MKQILQIMDIVQESKPKKLILFLSILNILLFQNDVKIGFLKIIIKMLVMPRMELILTLKIVVSVISKTEKYVY